MVVKTCNCPFSHLGLFLGGEIDHFFGLVLDCIFNRVVGGRKPFSPFFFSCSDGREGLRLYCGGGEECLACIPTFYLSIFKIQLVLPLELRELGL